MRTKIEKFGTSNNELINFAAKLNLITTIKVDKQKTDAFLIAFWSK